MKKVFLAITAISTAFLLIIPASVLAFASSLFSNEDSVDIDQPQFSEQALQYLPWVTEILENSSLSGDYATLILAIIEVRTQGLETDVMDITHTLYETDFPEDPHPAVSDPYVSIETGVQYLKRLLSLCGVVSMEDTSAIALAVQAYNFGSGYIPYAEEHGGHGTSTAGLYYQSHRFETDSYRDVNFSAKVMAYLTPSQDQGYQFPVPGYTDISAGFGWYDPWNTGVQTWHSGLDFPAPTGTPVAAIAGGIVTVAGWDRYFGNYIEIRHSNGDVSLYAHNSKLLADEGETVNQGQEIALVGATGNATGPHCHLELHINGEAVDPRPYLPEG